MRLTGSDRRFAVSDEEKTVASNEAIEFFGLRRGASMSAAIRRLAAKVIRKDPITFADVIKRYHNRVEAERKAAEKVEKAEQAEAAKKAAKKASKKKA